MSRTDKDRPYFVRKFDETDGGLWYHHDHRTGECTPETFEAARFGYSHSNHYRVCKKRDVIEFECEKENPYTDRWSAWRTGQCHRKLYVERGYKTAPCTGHRVGVYTETTPCACDDFPDRPNCFADTGHERWFYRSTVPRSFIEGHWTKPERQRERISMRDAARDYNANGELEDFDYVNTQHRHSATWYYW